MLNVDNCVYTYSNKVEINQRVVIYFEWIFARNVRILCNVETLERLRLKLFSQSEDIIIQSQNVV